MVRDFFSKLLRSEISSFVRISVTVASPSRTRDGSAALSPGDTAPSVGELAVEQLSVPLVSRITSAARRRVLLVKWIPSQAIAVGSCAYSGGAAHLPRRRLRRTAALCRAPTV